MKIAVIQASSQKAKNELLYACTKEAVEAKGHEVINFGINRKDSSTYSYIQTAFLISVLLECKAVDFVVTGCSSGQGMMLACNSLPGVLCGYVENPSDAFLFGRINDGNAVSFPLGLQFGWAGEINLQASLDHLFQGPFGCGYPTEDAERKQADTRLMKELNAITKRTLADILYELEPDFIKSCLKHEVVFSYICEHGQNQPLLEALKRFR